MYEFLGSLPLWQLTALFISSLAVLLGLLFAVIRRLEIEMISEKGYLGVLAILLLVEIYDLVNNGKDCVKYYGQGAEFGEHVLKLWTSVFLALFIVIYIIAGVWKRKKQER